MAEDFEPTPMMTDVLITPTGQEVYGPKEKLKPPGTPFYHECLPDTGCSASVISADLVRTYGLVLRQCFQPRLGSTVETNFGFVKPKWHTFTNKDGL